MLCTYTAVTAQTVYIFCTYIVHTLYRPNKVKYILCTCQYRIMNFVHTQYVLLNFDCDLYVLNCTDNCKYDQVRTRFMLGHGHTQYVLGTYEYKRVHPGCQVSRCYYGPLRSSETSKPSQVLQEGPGHCRARARGRAGPGWFPGTAGSRWRPPDPAGRCGLASSKRRARRDNFEPGPRRAGAAAHNVVYTQNAPFWSPKTQPTRL
jgi:hypothetical protein